MPRGRSTFTKRQKEQTRQQRQRDKAERRSQRKQENAGQESADEMSILNQNAREQAALFHGTDAISGDSLGEDSSEI